MLPVLAATLPVAVVALPHDWRCLPLHVVVSAAILAARPPSVPRGDRSA